jgi:5-methylcytosine-specific restriction enzyme subunit McrC
VYHRLNEIYRSAHKFAWLILDGIGMEDIYTQGSVAAFSFLLDMNSLFEKFVSKWLTRVLDSYGWQFLSQHSESSLIVNARTDKTEISLRPDVLLKRTVPKRTVIPLDAKYKLIDQRSVDPTDIYQAFVYAQTLSSCHQTESAPGAILVYPRSAEGESLTDLRVQTRDRFGIATVAAIGIDVRRAISNQRSGTRCSEGEKFLRLLFSYTGEG